MYMPSQAVCYLAMDSDHSPYLFPMPSQAVCYLAMDDYHYANALARHAADNLWSETQCTAQPQTLASFLARDTSLVKS